MTPRPFGFLTCLSAVRQLWLSVTALVLIALAAGGLAIWKDRQATEAKVRSDLMGLAIVLEQYAGRTLLPAASALANAVELATSLSDDALRNGAADTKVASLVRLAGVYSIWLIDRDGQPLLASNFNARPQVDIADRPYFREARDNPGRLVISPVLTTKLNQVPVIVLSQAFLDEKGAFRGVAVVTIHGNAFSSLFQSLRHETRQVFTLFRNDGVVIYREPWSEGGPSAKGASDLFEKEPTGIRVAQSSFDGRQRFKVWRRVPDLPLVVAVSVPLDDVFDEWWRRSVWHGGAWLVVLAALAVAGAAGARSLERESQVAKALAESEDRTRLTLQLSPIALVALDRELRYVWVRNNRIGATGEYRGTKPSDYFDAEGAAAKEALFRQAMDEGRQVRAQIRTRPLRAPTHQIFDVVAEPMRDRAGEIVGVVAAAVDVTARMHHQDELEQALAQRNVLLEEVHHRVKNNLQIIQSLLTIESLSASEEARPGYERSLARIQAMGLVHSLLYRTGQYSDVDISDYVQALVAGLAEVCGDTEVKVEVAPLRLPLDRAVPFGMIVNEALWNAIKHADGGAVLISARIDGPTLIVEISDQGPGFSAEENSGVGLRLMRGLAAQLDGEITFTTADHGGALVRLTLPLVLPAAEPELAVVAEG